MAIVMKNGKGSVKMPNYDDMGELGIVAQLNDKKNEFCRASMEIADLKKQIRELQGQLKAKEDYANSLMNNMTDICGRTGLTIYERSEEE